MRSPSLIALFYFNYAVATSTVAVSQMSDGQPQAPSPASTSSAAQEHPTCLPYQDVNLRYPPTVNATIEHIWTPPPPAWLFGNWKITYSSRPSYHALYNFQHDCYPVLPTNTSVTSGLQIDLTSFNPSPKWSNATLNDAIVTAFGYDAPLTDLAPSVYCFNGTGYLSSESNIWEETAWGYDTDGVGYRVEYETAAAGAGGPCINVLSRGETGPSQATLNEILNGMRELYAGNKPLLELAHNVSKLHIDGRRTGNAPVACDMSCMENADLVPT